MRLSLARSSPSRQADRTFPVLRLMVTVNDGYTGELPGAVAARLAADHAYIDALRRGEEPVDARLGPDAGWLFGPHQSNVEQARGR